jgi:membrane protein involved in colicin uptake
MARKPLRSQLNQIRAWVRQGRTDAWIAHQLDVSTSELRAFRKRHELEADSGTTSDIDLRDEIEAEVEAAMEAEAEEKARREAEEKQRREEEAAKREAEKAERGERRERESLNDSEGEGSSSSRPRRRRGRRGGRRRGRSKRPGAALQATFDHGETDGYGLWLDPVITEDPIYREHWAGERKIEVTVEPERIVIRRYQPPASAGEGNGNKQQD